MTWSSGRARGQLIDTMDLQKRDEISEMQKGLGGSCRCMKLVRKRLSLGRQLRKTGQAKISSRSCPGGASHTGGLQLRSV